MTEEAKKHRHVLSPKEEYSYWEENYVQRDYIDRELNYEQHYAPAYQYGAHATQQHAPKQFHEIDEAHLREGWNNHGTTSSLSWEQAKPAVEDAYNRVLERHVMDEQNTL